MYQFKVNKEEFLKLNKWYKWFNNNVETEEERIDRSSKEPAIAVQTNSKQVHADITDHNHN